MPMMCLLQQCCCCCFKILLNCEFKLSGTQGRVVNHTQVRTPSPHVLQLYIPDLNQLCFSYAGMCLCVHVHAYVWFSTHFLYKDAQLMYVQFQFISIKKSEFLPVSARFREASQEAGSVLRSPELPVSHQERHCSSVHPGCPHHLWTLPSR